MFLDSELHVGVYCNTSTACTPEESLEVESGYVTLCAL
jgi:hypothetical protein